MEHTKETRTFKTRLSGWIIDKTTETYESGRTEVWYELIHPDAPDVIAEAFQDREEMKHWAHSHPVT